MVIKASDLFKSEAMLLGRGKLLSREDNPHFEIQRKILDVATQQFIQFGYRKASISDIARSAAIGKGSVYLHFKSKRELFLSCQLLEEQAIYDQVDDISELPEEKRLRAYLECVLTFATSAPLSRALLSRPDSYASLIDDIGTKELQTQAAIGIQYITDKLIEPLTKHLSSVEQRKIGTAVSMLVHSVAHLPEVVFDLSEMQTKDFVKTVASIIDQGTRNVTNT